MHLLSSFCLELIYFIKQGKFNEYKINNYLNRALYHDKTASKDSEKAFKQKAFYINKVTNQKYF